MEQNLLQDWKSCKAVSVHEDMNPGNRQTMEDSIRLIDDFGGRPQCGYFAVYDGHGGRGAVEFIETRLEQNIAAELALNDGNAVEDKLARSFLLTDAESRMSGISTSGATAVVCILTEEDGDRVIFTANVGDSRAVLSLDDKVLRLSLDHKADLPDEQKRVEKLGGFIHKKRALGILAVSRSFGDHELKQYISCRPHVSRTIISKKPESTAEPFLVIACDGIWDVIDDEEAVEIVQIALKKKVDTRRIARLLVEEALRRDSTDNISAVVVFL